ncbi:MAG TPA: substrate-binding domain-containing protein [Bacteroidales bacterium]|jgi:phosphate transport system substrate-binding protein|nr:substrate-binding domain-containing protein [Bacteroidales bacterium]
MKNKKISIGVLIVTFLFNLFGFNVIAQEQIKGTISLSGAWALYPMAVKWAEEFRKLNPGVRIDISAGGAGKGITDALTNMVDMGMVSREIYPEEIKKGAYPVAVTKDAVVAVVNASNPALDAIMSKGLKREAGNNIWITGMYKTWAQAFGSKGSIPIHVYTRSDACGAAEVWAKYYGKKQEDLLGSGVYGDPGLALAVKKDPLGIGFNNIGYAYDSKTKKQIAGLRVVPLDINGDGKITTDENFYDTMDKLIEAIATGKFPSPPARELYLVTNGKPQKEVVKKFLLWILTDGQKFVNEAGYISLSKESINKEIEKLK